MVNRVLIRIKVVQLLYSYLLSRTEFKIDEAPSTASADKQYAYGIYTDMLLLILELSGYSSRFGHRAALEMVDRKLRLNSIGKLLDNNEAMTRLRENGGVHLDTLLPLLKDVYERIENSTNFTEYRKKQTGIADDVKFWAWVLEAMISRNDEIKQALRNEGGFSSVGFTMGVAKAIDTLRACADYKELYVQASKDLVKSLDNAYDLYLSLFTLIIDLTKYQAAQEDIARNKHLATSADLNPNVKFSNNRLVKYLLDDEDIMAVIDDRHIERYDSDSPLMRSLMEAIRSSELYKNYCESEGQSLQEDAEFWRDVLRTIVFDNDSFLETLESQSLFWNDDLFTMGTFALKTLRKIALSDGNKVPLLPRFKDNEDERFGPELFTYAVKNYDEYRKYIDMFVSTSSWDPERLAFMDIVIMLAAIAEIINYPAIPAAASVNEYVEIANHYSTDRSGNFINAILRNVVQHLNEQGIIDKK